MVQQTNITFQEKLWYSEEFQKLKRERKLSPIINKLLYSHLLIKQTQIPLEREKIEEGLREVAVRKALLMEKQEELKQKEAEEAAKEQQTLLMIPRGDDFHSKLTREKLFKENPELKKRYEEGTQ